jgi:hypothetical protein
MDHGRYHNYDTPHIQPKFKSFAVEYPSTRKELIVVAKFKRVLLLARQGRRPYPTTSLLVLCSAQ